MGNQTSTSDDIPIVRQLREVTSKNSSTLTTPEVSQVRGVMTGISSTSMPSEVWNVNDEWQVQSEANSSILGNYSNYLWAKDIQLPKNFLIIWLDSKVKQNNEIQMAIEDLKIYVERVLQTNNIHECEYWFMRYDGIKKIIFIVSSEFDKTVVPIVHELASLIVIYRYSLDYKIDNTWTQNYKNVRDIIPNFNVFVEIISRDLRSFNRVDEFNERFQLWNRPVQHTKSLKMQRNFSKNAEISSGI
jgi:hypothetical protein